MPETTIRLAPNVPVDFDVKYADIVSGTYGPQIRLRGVSSDGAARIYLDIAAFIEQAVACGALVTAPQYDALNIPEKGIAVRLADGKLRIVQLQAAGEKAKTLKVERRGQPAPAAPSASVPAQSPPETPAEAPPTASRGAKYVAATKFVLDHVVPLYRAHGVEPDSNAVARCVNTLFIDMT